MCKERIVNFSLSVGCADKQSAPGAAIIVFALRRPVRSYGTNFSLSSCWMVAMARQRPWLLPGRSCQRARYEPLTDVECGQKCSIFCAVVGFFLCLTYRRSTSVFKFAQVWPNLNPPSPREKVRACGAKENAKLQFIKHKKRPGTFVPGRIGCN